MAPPALRFQSTVLISALCFALVWSDDDWLKKFSGKTSEEADAEAAGGETTKTASAEVRGKSFLCLMDSLTELNQHQSVVTVPEV